MTNQINIGGRLIGDDCPVFVVAEIGINHNGCVGTAKKLIIAAKNAGCDAVKFQKRNPEKCVPDSQRDVLKETPWGVMSYLDYRKKIELNDKDFSEIDEFCKTNRVIWFASPWDKSSVQFLEAFDVPAYKISSACLTDTALLHRVRKTGKPVILSTGMSTLDQIKNAVNAVGTDNLLITHCTSTYPCKTGEINLRMIDTLRREFDCPVGYSGHETGLQISLAAVAMGACYIERHITLDRTMWGSDHAASVEPSGFTRLVRDIRVIEKAFGDGVKKVYDSEKPVMEKLRKINV